MKNLAIIIGSVMLVAATAYPVIARGPGWGSWRGAHMMGYRGVGPGSCWQYDRGRWNVAPEQQRKVDELRQAFYADTDALRQEIWSKSAERAALLNAASPDIETLRTVQKEISDLKSRMAQKRLDLELGIRKIAPEGSDARGYGRGYRKGYGRGYSGYRGGYGPGSCWD